jgi:hypothetical protein
MLQRMEAEILFLDPDDVGPGSVAPVEHGFEVEVLDWIDDYGPTVWIKARVTAPLARAASSTPTREGQMAEHEPCIGKTSNGFTPKP